MSEHVEVHRGGEVTLKSVEMVRLVGRLVDLGVSLTASRDGISASALVRHLVGALEEATRRTAGAAVAAVPLEDELPSSREEVIGTKEIAGMLGTKERNARDLCARRFETAIMVGGQWRVSRTEVAAYAAGRGAVA